MSTEAEIDPDLAGVRETARRAAENGSDLHAQIRDLTKAAFVSGRLDLDRIEQVTRLVLEGVSEAAHVHAGDSEDAAKRVRESIAAIEHAIVQAAEASTLAVREAGGRAAEFSGQDLKHARDDLSALESMLLDTLSDTASAGRQTLSAVVSDFMDHARNSGGVFTTRLAENLDQLQTRIPEAGKQTLQEGADAVRASAGLLAQVASGVLVGIGESLRSHRDQATSHHDNKTGAD